MTSAFGTQDEFRFMLHEGSVGAKVFVKFLRRLMVNAEKPLFLIVCRHPIHNAKMVKSYVENLGRKPKLAYLPPYSPHPNPDETVWANVKMRVPRQLVESTEEMKRLLLCALRSIQKLPELVKSFSGSRVSLYSRATLLIENPAIT